ncbi:MAG TPA: ROK family protein [Thermoleophilaceae bacterium]
MPPRAGVDLGGTKIQTVVLDDRSKVLGQSRVPTPSDDGPKAVVRTIAQAVGAAAEEAGLATDSLVGVGVGAPGGIEPDKGVLINPPNLKDFGDEFPLGPELEQQLGTRIFLGNDVSVATEAEFRLGAGKPYKSILGVFWGTGVGGGLILDGKQWVGRGSAGEIGHVVVHPGGDKCGCGRKGCMEAYAGRGQMEAKARHRQKKGEKTKLFEIMEKRGRERLTSGIWARALAHEDKMANDLIDQAIEALGIGVASCVNVLDPEAVIIGGGLGIRLGEPYAKRIAKAMEPHLFVDDNPPALKVATLGDLGGAMGAALLVKK